MVGQPDHQVSLFDGNAVTFPVFVELRDVMMKLLTVDRPMISRLPTRKSNPADPADPITCGSA